ncbi:MAG: hypothetical protein ACKPKO_42930 [Candidatus Fonsibacter sp.]
MINVGQLLKDDSFYAGHHPVYKNRFLLCKDRDEPEAMTWDKAMSIEGLFKLPIIKELSVLYAYRHALGFGIDSDWYWSSSDDWTNILGKRAWAIYFTTMGSQSQLFKKSECRVRLVRTVTQEELEALV